MLHQSDADILFPDRVIPLLRSLRGPEWHTLIDRVAAQPPGSIDRQAFTLMMIRLNGCLTCHANSHRAMLGCSTCSRQRIARYKEADQELVALFEQARVDIVKWNTTGEVPFSERLPPEVHYK
ncbi:MAG: hypothetical protein Kow00124_12140 [Anaerolineae bacterium]